MNLQNLNVLFPPFKELELVTRSPGASKNFWRVFASSTFAFFAPLTILSILLAFLANSCEFCACFTKSTAAAKRRAREI